MEIKAVYLLSEHSRLNTMKKIYRYLLLILLLSGICPLHSETIPADTLLMRLYERAASLMEKGELDQAQQTFDSAFAMPEAKQSPVYPILLNEQASYLSYLFLDSSNNKLDRSYLARHYYRRIASIWIKSIIV